MFRYCFSFHIFFFFICSQFVNVFWCLYSFRLTNQNIFAPCQFRSRCPPQSCFILFFCCWLDKVWWKQNVHQEKRQSKLILSFDWYVLSRFFWNKYSSLLFCCWSWMLIATSHKKSYRISPCFKNIYFGTMYR